MKDFFGDGGRWDCKPSCQELKSSPGFVAVEVVGVDTCQFGVRDVGLRLLEVGEPQLEY